jgi:hypothetical protein
MIDSGKADRCVKRWRKTMKRCRSYPTLTRRWYRPVEHECPDCHRKLQEVKTLSKRTVITLREVIKVTHVGYRCPDVQCPGHQRTYRSAQADALALPYFTYGVDIVLLVGRLRLLEHQTVDEVHQELLRRLEPLGVRIARREILYLFEAYCTLMRASSEAKDDQEWLAQVKKNGGILVSVDGIQPEKGNETVYVVRDALDLPRASRRECDLVRDRGDQSPACPGGGLGGGGEGEGARHDHRRPGERALGGAATLAAGAAPSLPIPRAARRLAGRLRSR